MNVTLGTVSPQISLQSNTTTRASSVAFSDKLAAPATSSASGTSGKAVVQAALDNASDADQQEMMKSMLQSIGMSAISAIQGSPTVDRD